MRAWVNSSDTSHKTCLLQDSTRNLLKAHIQKKKTIIQETKMNIVTHRPEKKTFIHKHGQLK